ncbi:MAG: GHKL domain-containing protein [Bacilli bacterium]|nr:GHKL domain-containing protein [Bacilli bacterium]
MVLQFIYFTYHHKISWVSLLLQICVLLVLSTLENEFVLLLYFVSIRYHDDTLLDTYETSNTRYQNKLLKNQVDEVQNIYMTMRGWRHDYHNHLQSLKAKLTKNQIDESIEYLNELEKDLDDIHQIVETGNINIDAILNSKLSLAMTHDIDVNVKVSIPTNLPINNIDCCVLLGNLIDNAIEACENVDGDKYIRLYIGLYKKQLYISITNATNEIVRKFDEEYITTKRGNHGHGLKRINKVVEKYNGYINRKNEPGVFVTEIMLPMNQTCTK